MDGRRVHGSSGELTLDPERPRGRQADVNRGVDAAAPTATVLRNSRLCIGNSAPNPGEKGGLGHHEPARIEARSSRGTSSCTMASAVTYASPQTTKIGP